MATGGFQAPPESQLTARGNPDPAAGQLWIESEDSRLILACELGDGQWVVDGGYARHDEIERPGRRSLTHFAGFDPIRLTGPIVIDGFMDGTAGRSVEDQVGVLERMAGIRSDEPPPLLRVYGNLPHDTADYPERRFVLLAPEWDEDNTIYRDRVRVRAAAQLTFLQHVDDAAVARVKGTEPFRREEMRRGENLRDFAGRTLGDKRRWREIVSLNRDDPRCPTSAETVVTTARRLKLPPRDRR